MPKRKRAYVSAEGVTELAINEASVSMSAAARLVHDRKATKGGSLRQARRRLQIQADSVIRTTTRYGDVRKQFEIDAEDGPQVVRYVCPHAWLVYLCESSPRFGAFLLQHVGLGSPGSICIYSDEVTPGNNLRPDRGRQFLAIYWAILPAPDWFRHGPAWWQTFAYLPCTVLKKITGGLSALYVKILECFWHPTGLNMQRLGIRVPIDGSLRHFHFDFGFFISDEKAEKEALGVKGASGTKICVGCTNCVKCNLDRIPAGSQLVHYTCSDMTKFVPQTEESLQGILAELGAAKARLAQTDFALAEQACGINYNAAVLLRSHMAPVAKVPKSRYPDWFHNLLASGGIFQYQLNQVVLQLQSLGVQPAAVDAFPVVFPKAHTKLKKTFFADRYVKNDKAHLKAFGSEVMTALTKMCFFMDVVAAPVGALVRHTRHLRQARCVVDLLLSGDLILGRLATLERLLQDHHELYMALQPQCAKPKLHLNRHLPKAMERHRVNVSCLPPERKHKDAKRKATFLFNGWNDALLAQEVAQMTQVMKAASTFENPRLIEPVRPIPPDESVCLLTARLSKPVFCSTQVVFRTLRAQQGDLILWRRAGSDHVGRAHMFVRGADGQHSAVVKECSGSGTDWDVQAATLSLVSLELIANLLPYISLGGSMVRVLQPFEGGLPP